MANLPSHVPDKVAQSFLKQYYSMLSTNPDDLYRFYNEQSSFTHSYGQHVEPSARGPSEIRDKVAALQLAGSRVDLSNGSVDAQTSVDNAVFVNVTGTFTSPDGVARPFVQSFFLATQPGSQNTRSYFVMNSVFRQLSVESSPSRERALTTEKVAQPEQVEADKGAGSAPHAAAEQPNDAQPEPTVVTQEPSAAAPVEEEEEEHAAEPVEEETEPAVVEEQSVATARQTPKSFLDAVKKSLPANGAAAAPAPAPAARAPRAPRQAAQPREEKAESKEERVVPNAIWISNVAEDVTSDELAGLFGKFGNIQKVDLPQGRGYAFVEYDTPTAVQAVLTAEEEFTLRDKQLKVEAKTSSAKAGRKAGAGKARGASPKNGERREKGKEGARRGDAKRSPGRREGARQPTGAAAGKN